MWIKEFLKIPDSQSYTVVISVVKLVGDDALTSTS